MLFGHMHAGLRDGGRRQMIGMCHRTVCVNTAEVPRWKEVDGVRRHQFTVCDLSGSETPVLQDVRSVWVAPQAGEEDGGDSGSGYTIVEDEQLYRVGGHALDTHTGDWAVLG